MPCTVMGMTWPPTRALAAVSHAWRLVDVWEKKAVIAVSGGMFWVGYHDYLWSG